ncbi:uncharacterized protein PV07_08744 [Cladophialophora immunda]|uniref:Uncharacterized protein n=1 Tax=Cladophialophora immunda TaxID=569365 RepID=A0A0D2C308_9EURO|nr:uncharacterized protein PV07_08744 [Cladophialophora immunda]KIW25578.1 hypothetical protein PV07_08744 [Cladophialophora immunda]
MSYADVNFGIDTMTTCILTVPFAIFFHYAYDVSPYDITKPRMLPLSEIPPQYIAKHFHPPSKIDRQVCFTFEVVPVMFLKARAILLRSRHTMQC